MVRLMRVTMHFCYQAFDLFLFGFGLYNVKGCCRVGVERD
jgi:hypothetical protein